MKEAGARELMVWCSSLTTCCGYLHHPASLLDKIRLFVTASLPDPRTTDARFFAIADHATGRRRTGDMLIVHVLAEEITRVMSLLAPRSGRNVA